MTVPAEKFRGESLRVVPTQERASDRPNIFVTFLDAQKEGLDAFSQATSELKRLEEEKRKGSYLNPFIDTYIEMQMLTVRGFRNLALPKRKLERWRENTRDAFLEDKDGGFLEDRMVQFRHLFPGRVHEVDELTEKVTQAVRAFEDKKEPVKKTVTDKRGELFSALGIHLEEDSQHLLDMADFLVLPDHAVRREDIRPFLTFLADHVQKARRERIDSMFAQTGNKWVENLTQDPSRELLVEFFGERGLKAPKFAWREEGKDIVVSSADPDLVEWLKFGIAMAKKIDSKNRNQDYTDNMTAEDIVAVLPSLEYWPKKLVNFYVAFLRKKINGSVSTVHTALEQFAKTESSVPTVVFRAEPITMEANGNVVVASTTFANNKEDGLRGKEEKIPFGFGIFVLVQESGNTCIKIREVTDDELGKLITKEAHRLAPNDKRVVADLRAMTEDLKERPEGKGVERIKINDVVVDGDYHLLLYRLSPRERGRTYGQHRLLNVACLDFRIVFAIDRRYIKKPTIVIEGIYRHQDFMRKFSKHSTDG